jgi:hypothetical protein
MPYLKAVKYFIAITLIMISTTACDKIEGLAKDTGRNIGNAISNSKTYVSEDVLNSADQKYAVKLCEQNMYSLTHTEPIRSIIKVNGLNSYTFYAVYLDKERVLPAIEEGEKRTLSQLISVDKTLQRSGICNVVDGNITSVRIVDGYGNKTKFND